MPTLRMEDDCLAPYARLKIDFTGKNPFALYKKAKDVILDVYEISTANYWERDFRWDISSEPKKFFVRIYAKRDLDTRSYILVEVIMQGTQPSDPNKEGTLTLLLNARLVTEFKLKNTFQKSLFYRGLIKLYNTFFYFDVRRRYLTLCHSLLDKLYNQFKSFLNIK